MTGTIPFCQWTDQELQQGCLNLTRRAFHHIAPPPPLQRPDIDLEETHMATMIGELPPSTLKELRTAILPDPEDDQMEEQLDELLKDQEQE